MELGKRLAKFRQAKGLTVYKLCELTGLSPTHIRAVERGAKTPNVETITRYLEPLDITLAEFFNEDDSVIYATPVERELIDYYRTLSPDSEELLLKLLKSLSVNDPKQKKAK